MRPYATMQICIWQLLALLASLSWGIVALVPTTMVEVEAVADLRGRQNAKPRVRLHRSHPRGIALGHTSLRTVSTRQTGLAIRFALRTRTAPAQERWALAISALRSRRDATSAIIAFRLLTDLAIRRSARHRPRLPVQVAAKAVAKVARGTRSEGHRSRLGLLKLQWTGRKILLWVFRHIVNQ